MFLTHSTTNNKIMLSGGGIMVFFAAFSLLSLLQLTTTANATGTNLANEMAKKPIVAKTASLGTAGTTTSKKKVSEKPGLLQKAKHILKAKFDFINDKVSLRSVNLIQWKNALNKKVIAHSCAANFVGKFHFSFDWKTEQCKWVNPDEHQSLSLQVYYMYETNTKEDPQRKGKIFSIDYDLWNNIRFSPTTVKHWLQGKGGSHFWLDHNCQFFTHYQRMLYEENKADEKTTTLTIALPGSKCQLQTADIKAVGSQNGYVDGPPMWRSFLFELIKKPFTLKRVSLIEYKTNWKRERAEIELAEKDVANRCEAKIEEKDKQHFSFDLKKDGKCKWVKPDSLAYTYYIDNDGDKNKEYWPGQFLSLEVIYEYSNKEEHSPKNKETSEKIQRYDLWDSDLFAAAPVKFWLEGGNMQKGKPIKFTLDPNAFPLGPMFSWYSIEKEEEGEKGLVQVFPTNRTQPTPVKQSEVKQNMHHAPPPSN